MNKILIMVLLTILIVTGIGITNMPSQLNQPIVKKASFELLKDSSTSLKEVKADFITCNGEGWTYPISGSGYAESSDQEACIDEASVECINSMDDSENTLVVMCITFCHSFGPNCSGDITLDVPDNCEMSISGNYVCSATILGQATCTCKAPNYGG